MSSSHPTARPATKPDPVGSGHREHFDKIAADYSKASDTWASVYDRIGELISPLVANRDVLDIGNGGFFPYDTRSAKTVTVLDISPAMLDRIDKPNVRKVVGDARDLAGIPDASQDIVMYLLCLHHIQGARLKDSLLMLDQIFASAARVLRPGGSVLIAEPTLEGFVYGLERAAIGVTKKLFATRGVPMIFFYKSSDIFSRLASGLRSAPENIKCERLPVKGWVDPLGGSFPGVIKIPAQTSPTRYLFIQAQKAA